MKCEFACPFSYADNSKKNLLMSYLYDCAFKGEIFLGYCYSTAAAIKKVFKETAITLKVSLVTKHSFLNKQFC